MSDKPEAKRSDSGKRKVYPRINFRVDQDLLDKIDMDAAAHGLKIGPYMRSLAADRCRTRAVRRPLADVVLLAKLKGEAGRVDGNLAQLLKLANRGEIVYTDELADAAKAVRDFYVTALETLRRGA
jgi:hypothetical protein